MWRAGDLHATGRPDLVHHGGWLQLRPTGRVVGFDRWAISGAGKLIDKAESCEVSYAGDTVNVEDFGGVVLPARRCGG